PSSVSSRPDALPDLYSFPTRRSSDLFKVKFINYILDQSLYFLPPIHLCPAVGDSLESRIFKRLPFDKLQVISSVTYSSCRPKTLDRKSTRLNSSHVKISYAVFCLKNK